MKLLKDILYKARIEEVEGSTNIAVEKLTFDSRSVGPYSVFVAVRGTQVDGHNYIEQAISAGALAIVCEEFPEQLDEKVTYIRVVNSAEALGFMAANFYDHPSEQLTLIGVTGTNGKTTVVTLLFELFKSLGHKVGMLSTVENRINNKVLDSTHTTPDPVQLNEVLSKMIDERCAFCFMEVSSHAIDQDRIAGLHFKMGLFTNITHDHLDYHGTFDNYIKVKKRFFDGLGEDAFALVNSDDKHSEVMLQNCKASKRRFAIKGLADHRAKIIENQFEGLHLNIDGNDVYSKLIGTFNASNILAAYSIAVELGEAPLEVLTAISDLDPVRGRFQYLRTPGQITGVVDYAHTPDALKNVLGTIGDIRTGNEKVITVVGCGGDRDKEKRPIMAKIACQLSDQVVLTSDNPRSEDPQEIMNDMLRGLDPVDRKRTLSILDRGEAIKTACSLANPGDLILVAGKGHETYQDIKGEKTPFNDIEVLNETLKMLEK